MKCYLPAMDTVTIYFLKALITGEKKRKYLPVPGHKAYHGYDPANSSTDIPLDAVKQVHVPSYENLSLKVIYAFFQKFPDVLVFLPDG